MKRLGLEGIRRGKVVRTTVPDKALQCPLDRVNRQFKADRPNQLWVRILPIFLPDKDGCMWRLSLMSLQTHCRLVGK